MTVAVRIPSTLALVLVAVVVAAPRAHEEFRFIGPIVHVDAARGRFAMTVIEETKEVRIEIALTPKTEITRDKKPAAPAALEAGVYVVVDALGDDYDSLEAVAVRIVPPPPT